MKCKILAFILSFLFLLSCKRKEMDIKEDKIDDFITVNIYPHDINSFTEGLFVDNGVVYESTGAPEDLPNTKSAFGILDLKTGSMDVKAQLDKNIFFGEGIAKINNKIYQLTYKNKTGFIYDSKTYKQ